MLFYVLFFSEQRHLTDTQFRLDDNSNTQRQLNEAAFHANLDLKAKQIQQNVEVCFYKYQLTHFKLQLIYIQLSSLIVFSAQ